MEARIAEGGLRSWSDILFSLNLPPAPPFGGLLV